MTGGWGDNEGSAELLHLDGSQWCTFPSLPVPRRWHTQIAQTVCDGDGDGNHTCLTFKDGEWGQYMSIRGDRYQLRKSSNKNEVSH